MNRCSRIDWTGPVACASARWWIYLQSTWRTRRVKLHRAEFFADDVCDAATDQRGCGGPVMQAEHNAGRGAGDSGDFDDRADAFEMGVRGHADSFQKSCCGAFV